MPLNEEQGKAFETLAKTFTKNNINRNFTSALDETSPLPIVVDNKLNKKRNKIIEESSIGILGTPMFHSVDDVKQRLAEEIMEDGHFLIDEVNKIWGPVPQNEFSRNAEIYYKNVNTTAAYLSLMVREGRRFDLNELKELIREKQQSQSNFEKFEQDRPPMSYTDRIKASEAKQKSSMIK